MANLLKKISHNVTVSPKI